MRNILNKVVSNIFRTFDRLIRKSFQKKTTVCFQSQGHLQVYWTKSRYFFFLLFILLLHLLIKGLCFFLLEMITLLLCIIPWYVIVFLSFCCIVTFMLPNLDADCDDNWLSLDVILANIPLYVTGKASVTELLLEWVNGFSRIEILHKNALRPFYIKLLNVLTPLNKNHVFGTFLWSKWPKKIWLFPNIYDNASHTLSGSQNGLKTGFYSIFVVGGPKIWIRKCGFLALLGLKWTQLVSKT